LFQPIQSFGNGGVIGKTQCRSNLLLGFAIGTQGYDLPICFIF
jgi:hypothetical protein